MLPSFPYLPHVPLFEQNSRALLHLLAICHQLKKWDLGDEELISERTFLNVLNKLRI